MSNIIKVRALEDFKGMQPEEWPFHVWLPYKQINSERFISEDTKEIWHRFDSVSIFDEDDPDDDLIEETEEFPDNIVSWLGKSGTIPAVGDTFQVLDHDNNVLFEETIHGTEALFGAKYAIAEKKAEFTQASISALERDVKSILGVLFRTQWSPPKSLSEVTPTEPSFVEDVDIVVRGIPLVLSVNEFITNGNCQLANLQASGFELLDFPSGSSWYRLMYHTAHDTKQLRMIGWGEGTAKEISQILRDFLCRESLQEKLNSAQSRITASGKLPPSKSEISNIKD